MIFKMINLDKPRKLRFGHKAIKMANELLGKNLIDLDLRNITSDELEMLFYCGMKADDDELELSKMVDILDCADFGDIYKILVELLAETYGGKEAKEKAKKETVVAITEHNAEKKQ